MTSKIKAAPIRKVLKDKQHKEIEHIWQQYVKLQSDIAKTMSDMFKMMLRNR